MNYAGIDRYVTYNHPEKTERIIAKLIYEMHKKKNDKKFQDDAKELINAFLHAGALAHDLECRTYMDDIYYIISSVNCS